MEHCMEPTRRYAWSPVWRYTKMYASNHTRLHGGTKQVCMELYMEPYMELCMEPYMEVCTELRTEVQKSRDIL